MNQGKKFHKYLDFTIIVLFAVQLCSLNFSIAVSSISFAVWLLLWLYKIIFVNKIIINPALRDNIKYVFIFVILFILFSFISRMVGGFRANSIMSLRRHLLFMVFVFTIFGINTRKELLNIITAVFVVTSLISVYEIIIYLSTVKALMKDMQWQYIRIDYFAYPLTQGQIKMLVIVFTLPMLFSKGRFLLDKKISIALFIPLFISMFLTQSRNVYLGIMVVIIIYGFLENKKLLMAFIFISLIFWFAVPNNFKTRIESIVDTNQPSNRARIEMWKVSKDIFLDYPVFGIGERFYHFEDLYTQYKKIDPANWGEGTHLHNNLLMILIEYGILGLIAFVGMFVSIFIKQIKFYKPEKDKLNKLIILGSILVLVAFHVAGIFDYNFRDQKVAPLLFFYAAIPFAIYKLKTDQNE